MEDPGSELGGSEGATVVDAETGLTLKLDRRGPPLWSWLKDSPCATSECIDDEDEDLEKVLGVGVELSPSLSPEVTILLTAPEDDGGEGVGEIVEDAAEGEGRGRGGVEAGRTAEKSR